MKKPALLLLAILAPSCGGTTSSVLYSGKDTAAHDGKLGIIGDKTKDQVTVCRLDHLLSLDLPYAEDWKADSSPEKLLFASSAKAGVLASVILFEPEKPVEDEAYLRDLLKKVQDGFEKRGGRFKEIAYSRHRGVTDNVVLEYVAEMTLERGAPFRQKHFWSVRQENGRLYQVHLSTLKVAEPQLSALHDRLRDAAGRSFIVLPR